MSGRDPVIHAAAAEGFAKETQSYARGRPDYPAEVAGWLRNDIGLGPDRIALELGAGTGKFTARLIETGAHVIAVEPVPQMREELERTVPKADARAGKAEAIPLADGSVDAVLCAQAFHWFATVDALREIHRVLKPGGALGLIWNVRDESVDWVAALLAILDPYAMGVPRFHSGEWRRLFPASGFGPLTEKRFRHAYSGPPEQVIVDRARSMSFIAALPSGEQQGVITRVRRLIEATPELAGRKEVTFPYETAAFSCVKL